MYSPPSAPLSIGGVIDEGLRLFRASFGRCWFLAIAPALISTIYAIAFPVALPSPAGLQSLSQLLTAVTPRADALDVVVLLLSFIFQGAVIVTEIAIFRGDESVTLRRALGTSVRRFPAMLLGAILFFLLIGICAVPLGIAAVLFAAGETLSIAAALIALAALSVGLWLWARLQLWTVALFVEHVSATDALASSWRLTRANWWRAAVIFTVAVIIVFVLTVVSYLGAVIAFLTHVSLSACMIVLQLCSLASNAIYYPLGTAIWLAMYHDFTLRREGGDLAARAGALSRVD